jgi:phospho-N-acetylmuramoyl-pentapeptide-transferase
MLVFMLEMMGIRWGPTRLLTSYSFIAAISTAFAAGLCLLLLPRLWGFLPRDGGRAFAIDAEKSLGKPVSAGVIIVLIFALVVFTLAPINREIYLFVPLMVIASFVGFIDDRRSGGLSELTLGLMDLGLAFATALILMGFRPMEVWLPVIAGGIMAPPWITLPITTGLIWLSINAMNCSDGVDGLSANLACISLASLAGILYVVVGNIDIATYLRISHNHAGADWALLGLIMVGCLFGYLWHNAPPSSVLMGDSGSRPIGLLVGTLVAVSGNPFLILVCSLIVLINGATGLLKVLLIRIFKFSLLKEVRFPLHDHVRKNLGWTGTQVLIRFSLLHFAITAMLLTLLIKVR